MRRYQTEGSRRLHQQTVPYLLDGVGSSFHVSSYRDYPVAMTHGKGSKLYDVDGNEYIDYVLGFGPMLLGYCPPAVDRAVAEQPFLRPHGGPETAVSTAGGDHSLGGAGGLSELGNRGGDVCPPAGPGLHRKV